MKQKIFRITLISCLLITSLLTSGTACAQDEELPDPGITPDSPFYFLDNWVKRIGLFFTFGPEAKARKALQYAEERLAEARVMAVKNRIREMTRAANDYDGFMSMVNERVEEARQRGVSDNISERVALATLKHLHVLDRIKDKVPKQAEEAIIRVRTKSMNGQINALRALAKIKPEKAIDIASDTIENRLERARVKATENVTADVEEALNYVARIAEIEEEMANIAQEKGIDIAPIQQRLAQATSNRLEVLASVWEKVPQTAKPAIENAIENSVRKYERAVETLKNNNALVAIPKKALVIPRIPEEVREELKLRTSNKEPVLKNTDNTTESQRIQRKISYQIPTHLVKPESAPANKTKYKQEDTKSSKVQEPNPGCPPD